MSYKRKIEVVPGFPGIYRIQVLGKDMGKWSEPQRGAKFQVARSTKKMGGVAKREWEFFGSFAEAKAYRNGSLQVPLPAKDVFKAIPSGMTFGQLMEEWKANWLPSKQLPTQIRYLSYLQHFSFLKEKYVEEIRATDIDSWIAHVKTPEYLARFHSTRCDYSHEFSVLKCILGYYASRRNRNFLLPFLRDHPPMLKVKEKPRKPKDLTVEQFKKFMVALRVAVVGKKCEVVFYVAVMQYLIYGRIQDAAALMYENFDFAANKIHVENKVQWIRKKGYEPLVVPGSKKNGGKSIEMSTLAIQFFREWVMKSGVRSGLLFTYEGGIVPYRVLEYRYSKALAAAGLPFTATHILRHASLTEYYDGCKDLKSTAYVAGHNEVSTTEKYSKVRNDSLVKNQQQMDEKLSGLWSLHQN
jgi:integrase